LETNKKTKIAQQLLSSSKEISENLMIVDLVRNDLSKLADKRSVISSELCKLYSFETVHQLISTVECTVSPATLFETVLSKTFPMGSMTGAPKLNSLRYIEQYEDFKRNIYSGTIGYIEPNGNFDFNVVIRTILYDSISKVLNIPVGGAITIKSNPIDEYNECLIKLKSISQCIEMFYS
jgi:para-aminobenzoate synthetase component 1